MTINIGIDLGTTNSALAYTDPRESDDYPIIHTLDVPQPVAAGRIENRRTLPSFLFADGDVIIGAYAREQGALVPTKSIYAAKSWPLEFAGRPDGEDSALGRPGSWPADVAGGSLGPPI